jgi:hypothetical protein
MKLLDTIKSWFATPLAQPKEDPAVILESILQEAGVRRRDYESIKIFELFEEWYDGECTKEAIYHSISAFKKEHPAVNAKLNGKL